MKKVLLNKSMPKLVVNQYHLDPKEKYIINLEDEMKSQMAIYNTFGIMGQPPCLKNYHAWLYKNGFNINAPNPTNEFVAPYYGNEPLWKTDYSQGIVVKAENSEDYYIVMECSNKNIGYKNTKVILTLGGCI